MLEVMKFIAEQRSNVRNDSMLEISQSTLIPKLLAYIKYLGIGFSVLQNTEILGF